MSLVEHHQMLLRLALVHAIGTDVGVEILYEHATLQGVLQHLHKWSVSRKERAHPVVVRVLVHASESHQGLPRPGHSSNKDEESAMGPFSLFRQVRYELDSLRDTRRECPTDMGKMLMLEDSPGSINKCGKRRI